MKMTKCHNFLPILMLILAKLQYQCLCTLTGKVCFRDKETGKITQIHFGDHIEYQLGPYEPLLKHFAKQAASGQISQERLTELENLLVYAKWGRDPNRDPPVMKLRAVRVDGKPATISFTGRSEFVFAFDQLSKNKNYPSWTALASDLQNAHKSVEKDGRRPQRVRVVADDGHTMEIMLGAPNSAGAAPIINQYKKPVYVGGSAGARRSESSGDALYKELKGAFVKKRLLRTEPAAMTYQEALDTLDPILGRQHARVHNMMTRDWDAYVMRPGQQNPDEISNYKGIPDPEEVRDPDQVFKDLVEHGVDPDEIAWNADPELGAVADAYLAGGQRAGSVRQHKMKNIKGQKIPRKKQSRFGKLRKWIGKKIG